MPNLRSASDKFEIPLTVIEGGSGTFMGVLVETSQNTASSTVFSQPRRILRVKVPTAARAGMVVRDPHGEILILADNGASDSTEGTLWQSFKLFRATQRVHWERRGRVTDVVTLLETEGVPLDLGMIWAAIEPTNREAIERRLHVNIEESQMVVGAAVLRDDTLDGRPVIRSDLQLGVRVGLIR